MSRQYDIRMVQRSHINDHLWNQRIAQSADPLIYATTWYLDAICDRWSALLVNDYEVIMPLPLRKKWGIRYLYTPFFLPAIGICCNTEAIAYQNIFLAAIEKHFRYGTLDLSFAAAAPLSGNWQQKQRVNFIINKVPSYSRLAKRKIAHAFQQQVQIEQDVDPEKIIRAYQAVYRVAHAEIDDQSYQRLLHACAAAPAGQVITLAAHLPQQPLAGFYLLLQDHKNVYSLLGGSTEAGKKAGVFYALTDAAIRLAVTQGKTFRFEGSDIEGIAFFNRQFGPETSFYTQLRLNRLPWPFNYLKP